MNHAMMADHTTHLKEIQPCVDACNKCHETCLHTAMVHCLEAGGEHVGAEHFRLMMSCAEICQTSANLLLLGSTYQVQLCSLCADICEACAKSCDEIGEMDECIKACHDCASSCRKMSAKS